LDPVWIKVRNQDPIRDKHPGSATLQITTVGMVGCHTQLVARISKKPSRSLTTSLHPSQKNIFKVFTLVGVSHAGGTDFWFQFRVPCNYDITYDYYVLWATANSELKALSALKELLN
jgi:hypothetical protein